MKIGIIGCGKISGAYFSGAQRASNLEIKACADLNLAVAQEKAEEYGCAAVTVDALLADPEIELAVNLTIPAAHLEVGLKILRAGKHLYAEKPLALNMDQGRRLIDFAGEQGLRVGSAPDTFLFKGGQTGRKVLDDGWIGRVTSGTALMGNFGHESWHPNPGFYYLPGGGPILDMGPYYITALVNLLGPVKAVMARTGRGLDQRVATSEARFGEVFPVEVSTHGTGILEFAGGVLVTAIFSFDTPRHQRPNLTLHGTQGSMEVGNPNPFASAVEVFRCADGERRAMPFTHADNQRMYGVVDMVDAIAHDRPHRASGELALHVLEVMTAFEKSSASGQAVALETTVARPAPLPAGLMPWQVG